MIKELLKPKTILTLFGLTIFAYSCSHKPGENPEYSTANKTVHSPLINFVEKGMSGEYNYLGVSELDSSNTKTIKTVVMGDTDGSDDFKLDEVAVFEKDKLIATYKGNDPVSKKVLSARQKDFDRLLDEIKEKNEAYALNLTKQYIK